MGSNFWLGIKLFYQGSNFWPGVMGQILGRPEFGSWHKVSLLDAGNSQSDSNPTGAIFWFSCNVAINEDRFSKLINLRGNMKANKFINSFTYLSFRIINLSLIFHFINFFAVDSHANWSLVGCSALLKLHTSISHWNYTTWPGEHDKL